ncbi:hypothetical protein AB0I39_27370 [Kitasatospora purpeofusca]|uniref:hypothetical protein n=1 Tax=Kitasatospora purpeofusca TaxID=67352 RepID=UPI00341146CE
MDPKRRAGIDTALYRLYTGNPPGFLKNPAHTARPLPLNSAVAPEQEILEHQVLARLKGGSLYSAHPIGIAWTRTLPGRTLVHLDPAAVMDKARYDAFERVLQELLPHRSPGEEVRENVGGLPGLRVAGIDDTGLHLTLAHHPGARLVLTGPSGAGWTERLTARHTDLAEAGHRPLWNLPALSPSEQQYLEDFPQRSWTWVGSGLLRRVGLLSRVSTAYSTHYWERGDGTLSVWLQHQHPALPAHDRLIRYLTDPVQGMSVRVEREHCDCRHSRHDRPYTHDHTYGRTCHVSLIHRDGRPGRLLLRFSSSPAREPAQFAAATGELRRQLAHGGAPRGWINRTLPAAPVAARPQPSLAERRAACTGETRPQAAASITEQKGSAFPVPPFAQMRLESEATLALGGLWGRTRYPFGIRQVRPGTDELIVDIEQQGDAVRHWAALLPRSGRAHEPGQLSGLRYESGPGGVTLTRQDTDGTVARITLAGISPSRWSGALTSLRPDGPGLPPTAGSPWCAEEEGPRGRGAGRYPEYYIGSGVLRMVAALRGSGATTGARLSLRPVTDPGGRRRWQWLLEVGCGPDHDALLTLLTDTDLALGLELRHRECTCRHAVPALCTMTLTDGGGQTVVVHDDRAPAPL